MLRETGVRAKPSRIASFQAGSRYSSMSMPPLSLPPTSAVGGPTAGSAADELFDRYAVDHEPFDHGGSVLHPHVQPGACFRVAPRGLDVLVLGHRRRRFVHVVAIEREADGVAGHL